MLFQILVLTFVSSVASLAGSFFLSLKKNWSKKFTLKLTAFSSGVLLSTALLHLAPEAIENLAPKNMFSTVFLAIIFFFVLERLVLWHHHHEDDCVNPKPSAYLVTIGDSFHNFMDGILITGTFLVDPKLGFFTALAVAAHEIPQEIADFSIMVGAGFKRKTALLYNLVSAMFSIVGAVLAYYFISSVEWLIPYTVAFSVGMFLYIALSDLIPELHHDDLETKQKIEQLALFFVGIVLIISLSFFEV
ncbi:MAG: ZIP family metal transporter [Candidatus Pacebacteria bacterium]|nr:ZIP family metal transporter [Candidatus Pacearchaeota archaeon]NCQ65824.1 ZIP family metal transporter [Candidatus Paceibacterota bacterium]NCS86990.1 ZIP family metal transporter [Candidatus Paceibacterota bacterium]PJC43614.1 MAG: ZIP zinc transporter [Candidatus Pacebacteria bacterium CG_4_9_14_0_2_um_filter_34_50]